MSSPTHMVFHLTAAAAAAATSSAVLAVAAAGVAAVLLRVVTVNADAEPTVPT
eukprot:CAMPEP_0194348286 /NCGR_PEP_ID=MMETSP0171-20130528/106452_1 /TAXON_ID=218684 /ORGANISM="Corethron pennatum, Strain L29A3" /LENGTH=52 /DNA_ID=CAMNT_0039115615 /DNA_START=783 /DNA_END=938 /DNA_ORIENTATION=+